VPLFRARSSQWPSYHACRVAREKLGGKGRAATGSRRPTESHAQMPSPIICRLLQPNAKDFYAQRPVEGRTPIARNAGLRLFSGSHPSLLPSSLTATCHRVLREAKVIASTALSIRITCNEAGSASADAHADPLSMFVVLWWSSDST